MSAFLSLHIIPHATFKIGSDTFIVERIFSHLHVSGLFSFSAYSRPLYWNRLEYSITRPIAEHFNIDTETAIRIFTDAKPVMASWWLRCEEWSKGVASELHATPEDIRGDFRPDTVHLYTGEFTLPSEDYTKTVGKFYFQVTLSGYGLPFYPAQYERQAREQSQSLHSFITMLEQVSDVPFALLIRSTY